MMAVEKVKVLVMDDSVRTQKNLKSYHDLSIVDKNILGTRNNSSPARYLLDRYSEHGLTERESECLFYLIRGKSCKGIGLSMNISSRTVEKYLNSIKSKFRCFSKNDIIEKLYQDGSFCIIPPSILNVRLDS